MKLLGSHLVEVRPPLLTASGRGSPDPESRLGRSVRCVLRSRPKPPCDRARHRDPRPDGPMAPPASAPIPASRGYAPRRGPQRLPVGLRSPGRGVRARAVGTDGARQPSMLGRPPALDPLLGGVGARLREALDRLGERRRRSACAPRQVRAPPVQRLPAPRTQPRLHPARHRAIAPTGRCRRESRPRREA